MFANRKFAFLSLSPERKKELAKQITEQKGTISNKAYKTCDYIITTANASSRTAFKNNTTKCITEDFITTCITNKKIVPFIQKFLIKPAGSEDGSKKRKSPLSPSTPQKKTKTNKKNDLAEDLEGVLVGEVAPSHTATITIPNNWAHRKFSEELKKQIAALKINLAGPIPFPDQDDPSTFANQLKEKLDACVTANLEKNSVKDLLLTIDPKQTISERLLLFAIAKLVPVLYPNLCRSHSVSNPSEMELTCTCFSSLLNLCGLFPSTFTNANTSINKMMDLPDSLQYVMEKISAFKPDHYVVFLVKKNNSTVATVRFIQEDKPDICSLNDLHEDFLKLVKELRATHRILLNTVYVSKKETFHDCLATYGILTSPNGVEIIALTSTIDDSGGQFSYNLHNIGTFDFENQSIELTACLLSLFRSMVKERKMIEDYLSKQKSEKSSVLSSTQKVNSVLRIGQEVQLRITGEKLKTCNILEIIDNGSKFVIATDSNLVIKNGTGFHPENSILKTANMAVPYSNLVLVAPRGLPMNSYLYRELSHEAKEDLALKLLAEVGAVHNEGIIHNDIKPENIIVFQDLKNNQIVKLIDFEISFLASQGPKFSTEGTPGYFPPEKEKGSSIPITKKSDVFSLGIVLGEILCGKRFCNPKLNDLCEWLEDTNSEWVLWKSLVKEMVNEDVSKRPTIDECFTKLKTIPCELITELQRQAILEYDWSTLKNPKEFN